MALCLRIVLSNDTDGTVRGAPVRSSERVITAARGVDVSELVKGSLGRCPGECLTAGTL